MSFGDSTNSHREYVEAQEQSKRIGDIVTDNLKNMYQFSEAMVLGEAEPPAQAQASTMAGVDTSSAVLDVVYYNVYLIREQRTILATHKKDHSFWKTTGFPKAGDRVTIKHKRDLFQAEITEVLSLSLEDALAKYGAITKKAG